MRDFDYIPIFNKQPAGASLSGQTVIYTLKVAKRVQIKNLYLCLQREGEEESEIKMNLSEADSFYYYYAASVNFDREGLYWYCFKIVTDNDTFYLEKNSAFNVEKTHDVNYRFVQTVYLQDEEVDEKIKNGIIYHIFVDRFNSSNTVRTRDGLEMANDWYTPVFSDTGHVKSNKTCYGGDFLGIEQKLDYLKSLNVSVIYLSPIFEAQSNHKYDVGDYLKIDDMFGGEEAFLQLVTKAKDCGIKIILDGVFNHTGSDSLYFNKNGRYPSLGAYQSSDSPYFDWYTFTNFPNEYECWWGIASLPQINDRNERFVNLICGDGGVIEKYMKMGTAGFRLDVVDELSDEFLTAISNKIKQCKSDALIVGEVWEEASTKIAYSKRRKYFLDGQLNSVTNYPLKNAIIDFVKFGNLDTFKLVVYTILDQYPKHIRNSLMNILGTHDTARILTVLGAAGVDWNSLNKQNITLSDGEYKKAVELLKMASLIQYTIFGIPTLYYGDEAGMQGMIDPFCRQTYPWGYENSELLEWYKKLGNLRKLGVFLKGEFKLIFADYGLLCYERVHQKQRAVIIVNKSDREQVVKLNDKMKDYFSDEVYETEVYISRENFKLIINI